MESTLKVSKTSKKISEKSAYLKISRYKNTVENENVNLLTVTIDSGTYLTYEVSGWEGYIKFKVEELPFPSSHNVKYYGELEWI